MARKLQKLQTVQGLVTERHFMAAEETFPGIARFYAKLVRKPRTFLELVWMYEAAALRACRRRRAHATTR